MIAPFVARSSRYAKRFSESALGTTPSTFLPGSAGTALLRKSNAGPWYPGRWEQAVAAVCRIDGLVDAAAGAVAQGGRALRCALPVAADLGVLVLALVVAAAAVVRVAAQIHAAAVARRQARGAGAGAAEIVVVVILVVGRVVRGRGPRRDLQAALAAALAAAVVLALPLVF